jgi:hypothetical protein
LVNLENQEKQERITVSPLGVTMEEFRTVYPFAYEAYMQGGKVYFALKDGERVAIFFDKRRGCFVIEAPGREPKMLLDVRGRPCKTLEQLSEKLKGMVLEHIIRGREHDME